MNLCSKRGDERGETRYKATRSEGVIVPKVGPDTPPPLFVHRDVKDLQAIEAMCKFLPLLMRKREHNPLFYSEVARGYHGIRRHQVPSPRFHGFQFGNRYFHNLHITSALNFARVQFRNISFMIS